jgi:hypothetical protein
MHDGISIFLRKGRELNLSGPCEDTEWRLLSNGQEEALTSYQIY